MNLILQLDTEIENRLREQAAASGRPPEAIALEALHEKLGSGEAAFRRLSSAEWQARLNRMLESAPPTVAPSVDDRRETIYSQRGE